MKTVHLFNKWIYILTLVLYLTIYLGLIAQIILGILQVILAIYLLIRGWKNTEIKEMLSLYFILISVYFLSSFTLLKYEIGNEIMVYLFGMILPMSIASYFVYITSQIHKKHNGYV